MRESVDDMQATLDILKHKLSTTSAQSTELLKQVTTKSCQLEKTKALLGTKNN